MMWTHWWQQIKTDMLFAICICTILGILALLAWLEGRDK